MEQVKQTLKGMFIGMGLYAVAVELVGVFFSDNLSAYTLGLFIGTIAAAFLIFHMTITLSKALDYDEVQATKYTKRQSLFRLLGMLFVLMIGVIFEQVNFIALVLGLLGVKIGALIAPYFLKKMYPEHYVTQELEEE